MITLSPIKYFVSKPENPPRSTLPDWKGLPYPPCSRSNLLSPKAGQDLPKLTRSAIAYVQALNPGRAFSMKGKNSNMRALAWPGTGQLNQSKDDWFDQGGIALWETIGWGGNTYAGMDDEKYPGYVRLETIPLDLTMPSAQQINWRNTPWLVHIMSAIIPKGNLIRIGQSWSLFTPMFRRNVFVHLYHKLSDLEPYPSTPMDVTLTSNMNVRLAPSTDSAVAYSLPAGEKITIFNYAPRGNDVWGSVLDKYDNETERWICLRMQNSYGALWHSTKEWALKTQPVPPPVGVWQIAAKWMKYQVYGNKLP